MENLQNWSLEMRKLSSAKKSQFIYQKGSKISLLVPLSWPNPCVVIWQNEDSMLRFCQNLESATAIRAPYLGISLYRFSTVESFVITMLVKLWEMAQDITTHPKI